MQRKPLSDKVASVWGWGTMRSDREACVYQGEWSTSISACYLVTEVALQVVSTTPQKSPPKRPESTQLPIPLFLPES